MKIRFYFNDTLMPVEADLPVAEIMLQMFRKKGILAIKDFRHGAFKFYSRNYKSKETMILSGE